MKKIMVVVIAMLMGSVAFADSGTEYGRGSNESAKEYEARIIEARITLAEASGYIDSNMIWVDNQDFQKTLKSYH